MTEKAFDKDATIFQENDVADLAYIVVSGRVDLFQQQQQQRLLLKSVEAGEAFGELALFDPKALRPYTAIAAEATKTAPLAPEAFQTLLGQCPEQVRPFIAIALEKIKAGRSKTSIQPAGVSSAEVKKITIMPAGRLKDAFKPVEVTPARLPFRIGGYPKDGESNRRDQLHLRIASDAPPLKISRVHCEITLDEQQKGLVLTDLGSRFNTILGDLTLGRGKGFYTAPLQKGANEVTLGQPSDEYKIVITCE